MLLLYKIMIIITIQTKVAMSNLRALKNLFIQGIRKSHLNFASKAFKASKYGHGTVQLKIVHMQEVVVPQNT